jgi:hypothetical protein
MATTTQHAAYSSIASALTTGLNSLANNTNSGLSSEIDNTTTRCLFMDLNLTLAAQGSARTTGAAVAVFMQQAMDGTHYPSATNETTDKLIAAWSLDAATTARPELGANDVPIPPGKFKLYLRNATGQTLASSGNLLEYVLHSIESV